MDATDVLDAAAQCERFLAGAVDADWGAPIPDMDWSVAQAVAHAAEAPLWYAFDLSAGGAGMTTMDLCGLSRIAHRSSSSQRSSPRRASSPACLIGLRRVAGASGRTGGSRCRDGRAGRSGAGIAPRATDDGKRPCG